MRIIQLMLFLSLLMPRFASAADWTSILNCDKGAATIDVNTTERRNLQLVIHDTNIINYFNRVGSVHSNYGATEIILSGGSGYINYTNEGPILVGGMYSGKGVFNPSDFSGIIAEYNFYSGGSFAYVHREGDGVKVQFGRIERLCAVPEYTRCEYDHDAGEENCRSICDRYNPSVYVENSNWFFQDCR